MKKHLLTLLLAMLTVCDYAQTTQAPTKKVPAKKTVTKSAPQVYMCEGGSAYAYHSVATCSSLNRCGQTVSALIKRDVELS